MSAQYFLTNPQSDHKYNMIHEEIGQKSFLFKTDSGVFSKNRVDFGSKLLVLTIIRDYQINHGKVLELGSGYGPILISLALHYPQLDFKGVEINQRAYQLAINNQALNKVTNISWYNGDVREFQDSITYDLVVTNPPIRAGKTVIQAFMQVAYNNLKDQGLLYLVIQKKQGAPSMKTYLEKHFSHVEKIKQDKGYWILKATK